MSDFHIATSLKSLLMGKKTPKQNTPITQSYHFNLYFDRPTLDILPKTLLRACSFPKLDESLPDTISPPSHYLPGIAKMIPPKLREGYRLYSETMGHV